MWTVTRPNLGRWAPPGWCCTLRLLSAERLDWRWHSNNSAGKWKSSLLRAKKGNYSPMPKKKKCVFCLQFMLPVMTQTGISDIMIHKSSQGVLFILFMCLASRVLLIRAVASKTRDAHKKSATIATIWKVLKKKYTKAPRLLFSEVFFVLFVLLKIPPSDFSPAVLGAQARTTKEDASRRFWLIPRKVYVKKKKNLSNVGLSCTTRSEWE